MYHFIQKQIAATLLCTLIFSYPVTHNQLFPQVKAQNTILASATETSAESNQIFTTQNQEMPCHSTIYLSLQPTYTTEDMTFSSTDPQTVWVGDDGDFIGYKGSTAEQYATTHDNITFKEISEDS